MTVIIFLVSKDSKQNGPPYRPLHRWLEDYKRKKSELSWLTMLEIKKKCSLNITLLNVLPYEL